jgi:hypothetical protein
LQVEKSKPYVQQYVLPLHRLAANPPDICTICMHAVAGGGEQAVHEAVRAAPALDCSNAPDNRAMPAVAG